MFYYLRQWLQCLKIYALICAFVSGPDRLPNSSHCIVLTIFGYLLLGFAMVTEQRDYTVVVSQILFELCLLALVAFAGLKWKGLLNRFKQTYSALIGINLIISGLTLPVFYLISSSGSLESAVQGRLIYATMAMVFWYLTVLTQIFKRAFEITTVMSAMIAFNYFILYQFTVIWI